jgi:hypothetical protein
MENFYATPISACPYFGRLMGWVQPTMLVPDIPSGVWRLSLNFSFALVLNLSDLIHVRNTPFSSLCYGLAHVGHSGGD